MTFPPATVQAAVATTKYFGKIVIGGKAWIYTGHWAIRSGREPGQVSKANDCRHWETKPPLAKVLADLNPAGGMVVERTDRRQEYGECAVIYAGKGIEVGIAQEYTGLLDACASIRATGEYAAVMGLDATGALVAVVMPVRL